MRELIIRLKLIKGGFTINNLISDKRINNLTKFWNSDFPKKYNRDQLIAFAKDDIEILLREREEILKLMKLFNVIDNHFNREEN
jgi:parvulin-like peptidyl-prolyl isomerase